jgi:hypothetical protein
MKEKCESWARHQDWVRFNYGCGCIDCVTWSVELGGSYQMRAVDDDRPLGKYPPHSRPERGTR